MQAGRESARQHQRVALLIWASGNCATEMFRAIVRRHNVPAIVVNQVGGNDQIVFDGTSFAMDAAGNVIASRVFVREDLVMVDTATGTGDQHANFTDECEAVYEALVLGTRDYIRKCGFRQRPDRTERRASIRR